MPALSPTKCHRAAKDSQHSAVTVLVEEVHAMQKPR
jgi:hypothetical protein